MKRLSRLVCAVLVTACAMASAPAALAQDARPKPAEVAATHFRRGVELYDEADFSTALVEFRRAYETLPDFRVLYNMGQAEYQLQRYAAALATFRRYLDEGGANVSAPRRAEVEREIAKLEGRVARLRIAADPGIDIFVDEEHVGRTPLRGPLIVSAGRHRIRAVLSGTSGFDKQLELAGGDDLQVPIRLAPRAGASSDVVTVPEPSEKPTSVDPRVVVWTATGLVAVAAVSTGIAALSASSDLESEKRKPPGATTSRELHDAATRATTLALVTDVLGGIALVGAGVGLYLTLKPSATTSGVRVAPMGATGLMVRASF